jgi:hypothetical protein
MSYLIQGDMVAAAGFFDRRVLQPVNSWYSDLPVDVACEVPTSCDHLPINL